MNNTYAELRKSLGRPLYVPFTVLGDPNPSMSESIIETLIASGADALELGLPFSDPPADGPIIQAADVRALASGITVDDCFAIIRSVHTRHDLPIGLLVYFNLILQRGIDQFYADCEASGVQSVLIADLPLEHMQEVLDAADIHGVAPVLMVSELTTDERLKAITKMAKGYLYLVSYLGVTGKNDAVLQHTMAQLIRRVRSQSDLPLFIGFGISEPEHVRAAVRAGADGVIVGSRIVREIPDLKSITRVSTALQEALES